MTVDVMIGRVAAGLGGIALLGLVISVLGGAPHDAAPSDVTVRAADPVWYPLGEVVEIPAGAGDSTSWLADTFAEPPAGMPDGLDLSSLPALTVDEPVADAIGGAGAGSGNSIGSSVGTSLMRGVMGGAMGAIRMLTSHNLDVDPTPVDVPLDGFPAFD